MLQKGNKAREQTVCWLIVFQFCSEPINPVSVGDFVVVPHFVSSLISTTYASVSTCYRKAAIGLITVFDAILPGRQSRQNLEFVCESDGK